MEREIAYLPGPGHSIEYLQSRSFLSPLITIGTTNQALPLFTILVAQLVALILIAYFVSFRMMGRDYDSAVMASGFIGFAMGTTANAVVNMRALVCALRRGARGIPRDSPGRLVLHRLRQRADRHGLRQLGEVTARLRWDRAAQSSGASTAQSFNENGVKSVCLSYQSSFSWRFSQPTIA